MERHFEHELELLREQLLVMGGRAEEATRKAIRALERREPELALEVVEEDRAMDRLEIDVEERCVRLLALQQPMARDLRFITAALKISNDLERVGDHAVNIAGAARQFTGVPRLAPAVDIPRLESLAVAMLRDALDAFVRRDTESARAICRRDDEVDQLNRQVHRELLAFMLEAPAFISHALELILVARNLERVADLATNIAEEVVFISEARIIKHRAEADRESPPGGDPGRP